MKAKYLFISLLTVILVFNACGGSDDDKSNDALIKSFTVDGVAWDINHSAGTIKKIYPKAGAIPANPVQPVIELSSDKATIAPVSGASVNIIEQSQVYTVTAEDGTQKTYTARGDKSAT